MDTKPLKDKILQLAIQGKLVPQDENDEPASALIEKIRQKKEQLIKDKIIKKEKPLPEINDDEKLFNLPNGWEWCRLSDIGQIIGGGTPSSGNSEYYTDNGIPWLTPADLRGYKYKYISNGNRYITELGLQKSSARMLPKGSVLFSSRAPIGYVAINTEEVCTNQGFKSIVPYILEMNEYIYYFLKYNTKNIEDMASGTTFKEISGKGMSEIVIPVPPLAEQKRISAKIDVLFKLIDELDSNKQSLLQNISDARNKILQLAIQGKLVEQDENDEPARVLLERIKQEKERLIKEKVIKKEKPLQEISEDEKMFDLPNGWEWCRLNQVSNYIKAGGDKPKDFSDTRNEEYRIPVIANGKTNTGIMGYTKIPTENNMCITVSGRGTIGYSCIRKEPFCPIVRLIVICPNCNINISYIHYVLQYFLEQGVGTSIQQLTVPMISPKLIPLPPIEEQKRIVAKLDTIMNYLDYLEKQIN